MKLRFLYDKKRLAEFIQALAKQGPGKIKLKYLFCFCCVVLVLVGCVQMRDYTSVRNGSFGLGMKTGFGEGGNKKSYYIIKKGLNIATGDTKNEIITKIGLPDKMDVTLDKYDVWSYEKEGLNLFFSRNRLVDWSYIQIFD